MVIIDRLLDWFIKERGYKPTGWSLVRIGVVALCGLLVAGLVLPGRIGRVEDARYNEGLATSATRSVALPYGDSRGFHSTQAPNRFRIAWIGGSEVLGRGLGDRAFIPDLVSKQIGRVGGKKISTDIYYEDAIRLTDELSALTSALASDPDLVVVSLNPVWVMNDLAVQQWGFLDGNLASHVLTRPALWPVIASLVSPGDVGWKAASRLSGSINDRFDWGQELSEQTNGLSFLHEVEDAEPPPLSKLGKLGSTRPTDFFFDHPVRTGSDEDVAAAQFDILEREVSSESAFNKVVLRAMLDLVDRAGVDAYFYLAPINTAVYGEPRGRQYIDTLRKLLAEATAGRTNAHVVLDPQGVQDRVPDVDYLDIVHVMDPKPVAGVLADDLCGLLKQWSRTPKCEGR